MRNPNRKNHGIVAVSALATFCLLQSAGAQVERSGGGETQKFMQQYQQLAAEKTELQAQSAQLKKDLDAARADAAAMKKERDALKSGAGSAAAAVAQASSAKSAAEQGLEQSRQKMAELVGRFREMAQNLKTVEEGRNQAQKDLAERNASFDACADRNLQLYEISRSVLDRYQHVGLFTKVGATEPFTKITRTRIENLVDDDRARAEELRVKKLP